VLVSCTRGERLVWPGSTPWRRKHGTEFDAHTASRCLGRFLLLSPLSIAHRYNYTVQRYLGYFMDSPVRDHYEKLLGPVYSWMVGDTDAAMIRADAELEAIGLHANGSGIAVDLGAGFGMHSVPLARRGYRVIAVDSCEPLLSELGSRAGSLAIRAVNANLMEFKSHVAQPAAAILCMGDTLTHLPNTASVEALFTTVSDTLAPGGLFAVTFRDYASAPLKGDGRFILVRSDENRILTCFLEYGEARVQVHDVLHERDGDQWRLRISSYPKLRLSPEWVVTILTSLGFTVRREPGLSGMVRVIAQRKP
jgi:hypothetical protein